MATDLKVVLPTDLGDTIKLGAKVTGKYDVDVSKLNLPAGITDLELSGTTLTAKTSQGDKSVDLAPILPTIAADTFLKNVTRNTNKIVFTVGEKDSTTNDKTFEIDVADLLPVVTDNTTVQGNGTTADPLKVKVSTTASNNILKQDANGLYVSKDDLPALTSAEARTIRLVNATGETVVGYIYASEQ